MDILYAPTLNATDKPQPGFQSRMGAIEYGAYAIGISTRQHRHLAKDRGQRKMLKRNDVVQTVIGAAGPGYQTIDR